jgi:hypothetical protein
MILSACINDCFDVLYKVCCSCLTMAFWVLYSCKLWHVVNSTVRCLKIIVVIDSLLFVSSVSEHTRMSHIENSFFWKVFRLRLLHSRLKRVSLAVIRKINLIDWRRLICLLKRWSRRFGSSAFCHFLVLFFAEYQFQAYWEDLCALSTRIDRTGNMPLSVIIVLGWVILKWYFLYWWSCLQQIQRVGLLRYSTVDHKD